MRKLMAGLVALVATAVTANAAPINYNEAVSGDLPTFGSPLPTFIFDAGTNTIRGTFGFQTATAADFDSFAFVVPAGMRIVAADVTLVDNQGDLFQGGWDFRSGSANYGTGTLLESILANSPGVYNFLSTPLNPGTYNVSATFFSYFPPPPASSNYVFSFRVQAIPEPLSIAVFGGVLAAGGLAVRRRVKATA